MTQAQKTFLSPSLKRALWLCVWGLLLVNIFLRLDFAENNASSSPEGYAQSEIFASQLLELPANRMSWVMPVGACVYHLTELLPRGLEFVPQAVFYILTALLLFGAGAALRGSASRFVAPAAFLLFLSLPILGMNMYAPTYKEDMLYALLCSIVAYALMLRGLAARRSFATELPLAFAIGISFMVKSPLVLLPMAVAAYDVVTGKLRRGETSWVLLLTGLLLPYLVLLPWIYMNWRVYNIFTFFELFRAEDNIISGAMGVVCTTELTYLLAGISQGEPVLSWAAQTVWAHPVDYISSVLQRAYMMFSWFPVLSALFLAAMFRFRKDEVFRLLTLFVCYFAAMHSLLSIEPRYFYPLYPALLLGASALINGRNEQGSASPKLHKTILAILLLPLAACYALVSTHLISYSKRAMPAVKAVASKGNSADAATLIYASRAELGVDDENAAYAHARRALLEQYSYDAVIAYAYALLAKNKPAHPILQQRLLDCDRYQVDCLLIETGDSFLKNNYAAGRHTLYRAYLLFKEKIFFFSDYDAKRKPELDLRRRLRMPPIVLGALSARLPYHFQPGQGDVAAATLLQLTPENTATSLLEMTVGCKFFISKIDIPKQAAQQQPRTPATKQSSLRPDLQTRLFLLNILLALNKDNTSRLDWLSAQAVSHLTREDIFLAMDQIVSPPDGITLARIYLRSKDDYALRVKLIEKLLGNQQLHEAAADLARLPDGPDNERLIRLVLGTAQAKRSFEVVDQLNKDNDYPQFMDEAKAYLQEYPFDKRVRQMLDDSQHYKSRKESPI